jgi:PAS domain S-box-containing protein
VANDTDGNGLLSSLEALDEALFRMSAVRDADGRIVDFRYEYCNRAGLTVLQRRREEVLGRSLLEMFPAHRTNGLFDAFVRVTETGEPYRFEFEYDEGGVRGDFEIVANRVGDGYVVAGHDITERKQLERELATTRDQLQSALASRIVIEQAKGYLAAMTQTSVSRAFELMRRYSRNHNTRLTDVARAILDGEIDLTADIESTG